MTEPTQESKNTPNMQVSVEQLSDIERKVAVEIPWDDVKSRLDEAYSELQQGVTIKGWRHEVCPTRVNIGHHFAKAGKTPKPTLTQNSLRRP